VPTAERPRRANIVTWEEVWEKNNFHVVRAHVQKEKKEERRK
tara:strand:+ start:54 stop:179 length:126 start_codon:yes stop_codon:yes gene_type:complete